jgi:hypothetical protein
MLRQAREHAVPPSRTAVSRDRTNGPCGPFVSPEFPIALALKIC